MNDEPRSAIADFLTSVASHPSGLVLEGEAGIGKTTLWLAGVEQARARGCRVLAAQPTDAASVQAYESLADLLSGVDPAVWTDLPEPQRFAIDQVLLRTDSEIPATGRRAVAAAFLSIIGRLTDETPVLLAIDDLQWVDPSTAHVVEFAVRRLTGPVGVLCAERTDSGTPTTASWLRLPRPDASRRIRVPPLSVGRLHEVLSERLGRTLPRPTTMRIQEISGGNPFYAIELARALHTDAAISEAALPGNLAELVQSRIGGLDPEVQELLLAAACAASPTVELIARASGVDTAQVVALLEVAEDKGIVGIDGERLRFAHPLLAQGVYANASPGRRRRMHRRLADVIDQPELQARHLALSATTGDPATLQALDAAAENTRRRGAPAAAAELLELAIGLGGDTAERRIRLADHHWDAGDFGRARALLEESIRDGTPGIRRAEALSLLGHMQTADDGFVAARESFDRALLEVGDHLALRVRILTRLAFALLHVGDLAAGVATAQDAVIHAERLGEPQLLSQALSMRVYLGALHGEGIDQARLKRSLDLEDPDAQVDLIIRPRPQNAILLAYVGRLDEAKQEMEAIHRRCLDRGEEPEVIAALFYLGVGLVWSGRLADAAVAAEDAMERALQLGADQLLMWSLTVRATANAYTGRVDDARRDVTEALAASQRTGATYFAGWQLTTLGFLEVSLGNHAAASSTLEPLVLVLHATPDATELFVGAFIPDAVEAFVALGRLDEAEPLVAALESNGARLDRPWMLAVGCRCRAMLQAARGDLDAANVSALQAMTEHDRLPMPFERARTQLVVGQLQRRRRQHDAAATTLREALRAFEDMGATLWARRARTELDRTTVGPRRNSALTPTEQRVAELAASGMTNRDVAAALFISPKTVEANLSRIYHKLGIRSRAELGHRVGQADRDGT